MKSSFVKNVEQLICKNLRVVLGSIPHKKLHEIEIESNNLFKYIHQNNTLIPLEICVKSNVSKIQSIVKYWFG